MPYHIEKGSGARPIKIVRDNDGVVVGTSTSRAKAVRSIAHRMSAEPSKNIKHFKRKVDNKMRDFGETDLVKKTIRINKSKKLNKAGDIINTIVHEKRHILHPNEHEKTVRKKTKQLLKKMTPKQKSKHYSLFKK